MNNQLLDTYGVNHKLTFGSNGFVYLVDTMGNDEAICQAARISYGAGTKGVSSDTELIRYLVRNHHTTPLEMCEIKLHLRLPMDTWRQMVRHRTASINEYSTRYSVAIDAMAKTKPELWRLQSKSSKQGSSGYLRNWPSTQDLIANCTAAGISYDQRQPITEALFDAEDNNPNVGEYLSAREQELHDLTIQVYQERLALGVAREQARKDLPLSTYTEVYWKIDLHNLLHFLWLREDPHAQQEIREIANHMATIVEAWCPIAYKAFVDFKQEAVQLSAGEQTALTAIISAGLHHRQLDSLRDFIRDLFSNQPDSTQARVSLLERSGLTSKTERIGFAEKLKHLLSIIEDEDEG